MNKIVISAVSGCALIAMSAFAFADVATTAKADPTLAATMFCRPSAAGERATATIGDQSVVCKKMPVAMMVMTGKGGPDLSKALSAEQVDRAWRDFIATALTVHSGDGGG